MRFAQPLIPGVLERRYKRFLADVRLEDGSLVTCHCPNTGSMLGCQEPGSRVWLSRSDNPKRKYALTWELVELPGRALVGIHTGRANGMVREALEQGRIPELADYPVIRPEVRIAEWRTRIDFLLSGHGSEPDAYVEVKNVTAAVDDGIALFPDAVSARGTRHLQHLQRLVAEGCRAALVFCVQRDDVTEVRPADAIDPAYGRALRDAIANGVEVHALGAEVNEQVIELRRRLPVVCPTPELSPT
ncbi:DNA/RNA nuclease SfsA [Aquisalimonas asiatica]|uniref:Sugar fermentation stimulation protein homolog n=1 Tax=Aquisalimonas asiatica TaxID=406100 RepID=A0A1H8QFT4_9GAMM|nr:DNA/RNA nuclease SfsA [Aquisalimonas asiatica]SEO52878.1 sugar fermentation stimulation protein A [Aquisalimonas asiatica]